MNAGSQLDGVFTRGDGLRKMDSTGDVLSTWVRFPLVNPGLTEGFNLVIAASGDGSGRAALLLSDAVGFRIYTGHYDGAHGQIVVENNQTVSISRDAWYLLEAQRTDSVVRVRLYAENGALVGELLPGASSGSFEGAGIGFGS